MRIIMTSLRRSSGSVAPGPWLVHSTIAVGTSRLYELPYLRRKFALYRKHRIRPFIGGQFQEYVFATYGAKAAVVKGNDIAAKFPRQALHSSRISFRQPRTGRELTIEAPLPADMKALAEAIGLPL